MVATARAIKRKHTPKSYVHCSSFFSFQWLYSFVNMSLLSEYKLKIVKKDAGQYQLLERRNQSSTDKEVKKYFRVSVLDRVFTSLLMNASHKNMIHLRC